MICSRYYIVYIFMPNRVVLTDFLLFSDPPILTYNFTGQQNLTESSDMIVFTCTVESYPASTILWYKNGSPYVSNIISVIKTAESSKSFVDSSLVFPTGIKRTDYGQYSCNATNILGNVSFSTRIRVWCKFFFKLLKYLMSNQV